MPAAIRVPAFVWVTLLLVAGGLALIRARDVLLLLLGLTLIRLASTASFACRTHLPPAGAQGLVTGPGAQGSGLLDRDRSPSPSWR